MDPFDYLENMSIDYDNSSNFDRADDDALSILNPSVTWKNLKLLSGPVGQGPDPGVALQTQLLRTFPYSDRNQTSSTNISLASSGSDYQRAAYLSNSTSRVNSPAPLTAQKLSQTAFVDPQYGDRRFDPAEANVRTPTEEYSQTVFYEESRPLSRNSATSCLLTTATKDGIEGKRFHRQGPTHYSSNVFAAMLQNQGYQASMESDGRPFSISPVTPLESITGRHNADNNYSQVSVSSQLDGKTGKRTTRIDHSTTAPPVTLKEKINMLNTDSVHR